MGVAEASYYDKCSTQTAAQVLHNIKDTDLVTPLLLLLDAWVGNICTALLRSDGEQRVDLRAQPLKNTTTQVSTTLSKWT